MEKSTTTKQSSFLLKQLPVFMPDATLGVVRSLSPQDLQTIGLDWLMVNTYHLWQKPGEELLRELGGVKKLMNWSGFLASDSGGFQLFSLIQKNPNLGKITDQGIVLYAGPKKQRKTLFTPEDSIRLQFVIGSDIKIVLDDFTPPTASESRIEKSVKRTIAWAKRAKIEFDRQLKINKITKEKQPLLLAPIQGHNHKKWRTYCADALQEIGFNLYGLGGWPFQTNGQFDYNLCQFNAQLTTNDHARFALGVGNLENITRLFFMGYQFFDCVLPTRDARHQRLYVFKVDPQTLNRQILQKLSTENRLTEIFDYLYISQGKYANDQQIINQFCDCPTCQNEGISRAYLHHLFKVKDTSAFRLATLHNLRTFKLLIEALRR